MGAPRKRSTAITLVLAGSAALSGCGNPESQRDVYLNLDDCKKDWGNPAQCEPVQDGKHSSHYFYGPRYYGSSFPSGRPKASPNALEAAYAGRGGVSQLAGSTSRSRSTLDPRTWFGPSERSGWSGSTERSTSASRSASDRGTSSSSSSSVSGSGFGSSARSVSSGG
jgi:hypothetical protein